MFIFGHIGLTIGMVFLGLTLAKKTDLLSRMDLRFFIILAILPDLIDKSLGHIIFRGVFDNGRLFSHTLVFVGITILIFYLVIRQFWWFYALPIVLHQVFDMLWDSPSTWFWPYFGWGFEKLEGNVWANWFHALLNDPYIYLTEIFGVLILVFFIVHFRIYSRDNLVKMIKTGLLSSDKSNGGSKKCNTGKA